MSKDRRKVKMVHFENHAYYIHEKVFTNGYSFMLLEYRDENAHLGDMMQKTLRYLNKFWKQLFTYRKDGRYGIDNNIAERNIRPLTVERKRSALPLCSAKNSLFFGNHVKADVGPLPYLHCHL